ncbi:hypothetical protein LARI1_G008600 [Lachnellula arida]|uniref:Uncharacterized protein n=1 Tax=Lachnellula arida TaxID=1316785 RepID=A0A8T9AYZ3_9HELO|nr:hypothetical protein LARI1_G008600 [Lachnellula arida]
MSTLKSYPGMLSGNNGTLPPFMHLQSRASLWKTNSRHVVALPEPLAICSNVYGRSPGNVAFIWRTIQAESQRLEDELNYDAWTTLHAIQAMAIYIILGLLGDNSEYAVEAHILIPILSTTKRMANKDQPIGWIVQWRNPTKPSPSLGGMGSGRVSPTVLEYFTSITYSRFAPRRQANIHLQTNSTAIILVIIIHIFNIEHGHGVPQCGGFSDLSLPCSKTLWEASDQATWETEYRKQYMRDSYSKSG